jgi:DedD protein
MPRYFEEDDDADSEEPRRDTELTLGWGALTGMALALLAICAVCFGLGYMVGHRGSAHTAAAASSAQPNAPDQEPLQGSASVPKPSANAQADVPPPALPGNASSAGAQGSASSGSATAAPNAGAQDNSPQSAPSSAASPQVRPALGANAPENPQMQIAPNVHAAMPSENALMVQVAAVRNEEDASVLTNALRRRGYPVISHRDPVDELIHVRIGPFPTRDEANQWRMKLLDDGYNAVVQP